MGHCKYILVSVIPRQQQAGVRCFFLIELLLTRLNCCLNPDISRMLFSMALGKILRGVRSSTLASLSQSDVAQHLIIANLTILAIDEANSGSKSEV